MPSSLAFAQNLQTGRKEKFLILTNAPSGTCNPDQLSPAQVNFADHLAPVFRSSSGVNCHAVAAQGFAVRGDGANGLPAANWVPQGTYSNHPVVSANTNCGRCHGPTLEDVKAQTPTLNIAWQAAPSAMDFRGLADADLCAQAQSAGSLDNPNNADAQEKLDALRSELNEPELEPLVAHLAHDPLVLWAVTGGDLPTIPQASPRGSGERAYNGTVPEWQELVRTWVDNGMPCQ